MSGDSDLRGIEGVGSKRAQTVLTRYGTLDNFFVEGVPQQAWEIALANQRAYVEVLRTLVDLFRSPIMKRSSEEVNKHATYAFEGPAHAAHVARALGIDPLIPYIQRLNRRLKKVRDHEKAPNPYAVAGEARY
jgi:hypothetical protein